MKKLSITLLITLFAATIIYAGNIDFRNISGVNSSKQRSQTKTYKKSSFNAKSSQFKYYTEDSKTEAVVKISAGLLSNIKSNEKGTYSASSVLTVSPYTSTFDYGLVSKSRDNRNTIFDLAFEIHYFMYEKFGVGGGLSIPLNIDIPHISASLVNPYISFKIKNFTNEEELDNFYLLLNIGTLIPIYAEFSTSSLNLGYDIGVGYEYNSFIFELLYSYYSMDFDSLLAFGTCYRSYNPDNYTRYSYSEYISEEKIDISRLKFVVGYKFAM
ncbi:MAG: hypothetical protein AB7E39_05335 [Endomicrobiaceae bacterium]